MPSLVMNLHCVFLDMIFLSLSRLIIEIVCIIKLHILYKYLCLIYIIKSHTFTSSLLSIFFLSVTSCLAVFLSVYFPVFPSLPLLSVLPKLCSHYSLSQLLQWMNGRNSKSLLRSHDILQPGHKGVTENKQEQYKMQYVNNNMHPQGTVQVHFPAMLLGVLQIYRFF